MPASQYYPDLRLNLLKLHAVGWAKRYGPIDSIRMYRATDTSRRLNDKIKYILVITFPIEKRTKESVEGTEESVEWRCKVDEDLMPSTIMDRHFIEIYRSEPDWHFRDEWWVATINADEEIPEYLNRDTCCQLYRKVQHSSMKNEQALKKPVESGPSQKSGRQENMRYAFIRNGDYWEIGYEDEHAHIRDRKRLHYLIHLLEQQGKEISNEELVRKVNKTIPDEDHIEAMNSRKSVNEDIDIKDRSFLDEGMRITKQMQWDNEDNADYNRILKEHWSDLEDAKRNGNEAEIKIAQEEFDRVLDVVKSVKPRSSSVRSKARKNVAANIKNVIKDISNAHPHLTKFINYIKKNVRISTSGSRYVPDNGEKWTIKW